MARPQDGETASYKSKRRTQKEKHPTILRKIQQLVTSLNAQGCFTIVPNPDNNVLKTSRYYTIQPTDFERLLSEQEDRLTIIDDTNGTYVKKLSEKHLLDAIFPEPTEIKGRMMINMNDPMTQDWFKNVTTSKNNNSTQQTGRSLSLGSNQLHDFSSRVIEGTSTFSTNDQKSQTTQKSTTKRPTRIISLKQSTPRGKSTKTSGIGQTPQHFEEDDEEDMEDSE